MLDDATGSAAAQSADLARYTVRDSDSLWTGVERALDNGLGVVLVVDAAGTLVGRAGLDGLRAAVRKGAHLGAARMGELAAPCSADDTTGPPTPVLDGANRVVGVTVRPEAGGLPVAEPDLSHAELRNLIDAYLSTWISSTGDYVRAFEQGFAAKAGLRHGVSTSDGTVSLQLAL